MQTLSTPAPFLMLFREKSHARIKTAGGVYNEDSQRMIYPSVMGFNGKEATRTQIEQDTWTGDVHKPETLDSDHHSDPDDD